MPLFLTVTTPLMDGDAPHGYSLGFQRVDFSFGQGYEDTVQVKLLFYLLPSGRKRRIRMRKSTGFIARKRAYGDVPE